MPGIGGQVNTFAVTGAAPNTSLRLYASKVSGVTLVPSCPLLSFELGRPMTALGDELSDSSGSATFAINIPAGGSGKTFHFQVGDASHCALSSRVVFAVD